MAFCAENRFLTLIPVASPSCPLHFSVAITGQISEVSAPLGAVLLALTGRLDTYRHPHPTTTTTTTMTKSFQK